MRFQTLALSAAIATSIVAIGVALRLAVSHRASDTVQPALSTNLSSEKADLSPGPPSLSTSSSQPANLSITPAEPTTLKKQSSAEPSPITQPPAEQSPADPSGLFNHLPYQEADPARLQIAGQFVRENFERSESLDLEAANAFIIMVNEAQAQGIHLMPISGYRSVNAQQELFTQQTEKYGSAQAAAQLSAPPEHSEHHTGYAIDIGDRDRPEADLDPEFANTAAYQWLLNNAYVFGFEQSFPQDNPQGLSFEPWHWRYVQSERAARIFESARGE